MKDFVQLYGMDLYMRKANIMGLNMVDPPSQGFNKKVFQVNILYTSDGAVTTHECDTKEQATRILEYYKKELSI